MDKSSIVFLDAACPDPYSLHTLRTAPMGGTEATVVRVAEGLAARGHQVYVLQHNRQHPESSALVDYLPFEAADHFHQTPGAVIALRSTKAVPFMQKTWGTAKRFLWLHDYNQQDLVQDYALLQGSGIKILGVSRTHKSAIIDCLLRQVEVKEVTVGFIYNPVVPPSALRTTIPEKLVYFSSPHKGLDLTFHMFAAVRRSFPEMKLYVANPGYITAEYELPEGVVNLGSLKHAEMMEHLSEAFAVFHMNAVFPETFGLVHAEAQALGVPCLTSALGANYEILSPARGQMVDVRDARAVVERIAKWRGERPSVSLKPEFQLESVLDAWEGELC